MILNVDLRNFKMGLELDSFSATNDVLTKKHSLLKSGEISVWSLNQGLEVQLDNLIDTRNSVIISWDLYFILHFAFINKIYFQLRRISICTYVGLKFFLIPKIGFQGRKVCETLL